MLYSTLQSMKSGEVEIDAEPNVVFWDPDVW